MWLVGVLSYCVITVVGGDCFYCMYVNIELEQLCSSQLDLCFFANVLLR